MSFALVSAIDVWGRDEHHARLEARLELGTRRDERSRLVLARLNPIGGYGLGSGEAGVGSIYTGRDHVVIPMPCRSRSYSDA